MGAAPVHLVPLLGSLSLACDAADGFAPETTMRSALLAAALARELEAPASDDRLVADVLVGGLLRHIGCTAFSVEEAHRYGAGDDIALRQVMAEVDFGQPERAVALIRDRLAAGAEPAARAEAVGRWPARATMPRSATPPSGCRACCRLAWPQPVWRAMPSSAGTATAARPAVPARRSRA